MHESHIDWGAQVGVSGQHAQRVAERAGFCAAERSLKEMRAVAAASVGERMSLCRTKILLGIEVARVELDLHVGGL